MERTVATVDANGQLTLPAEIQAALGIRAGAEVEIVLENQYIRIVQAPETITLEEFHQSLRELQAHYAGQSSLEDDLYEMRREEEEHARRKFGC